MRCGGSATKLAAEKVAAEKVAIFAIIVREAATPDIAVEILRAAPGLSKKGFETAIMGLCSPPANIETAVALLEDPFAPIIGSTYLQSVLISTTPEQTGRLSRSPQAKVLECYELFLLLKMTGNREEMGVLRGFPAAKEITPDDLIHLLALPTTDVGKTIELCRFPNALCIRDRDLQILMDSYIDTEKKAVLRNLIEYKSKPPLTIVYGASDMQQPCVLAAAGGAGRA